MRSSKAIAPQRSPTSSATSATAASTSSAASSTVPRGRPGASPASGSAAAESRPASTSTHHVAVLLDAVLVAHRPPEPRGRPPVDLAHVVVGQVVADELEVGAEPERPAGRDALLAEAALADRAREPPRRRQVGVDGDLRGRARRGGPRSRGRAGRACASRRAGSSWRPRRRATSVASSAPSASRGASSRSGGAAWRIRTVVPAAGAVVRARSAAGTPRGEHLRHLDREPRRRAGRARVGDAARRAGRRRASAASGGESAASDGAPARPRRRRAASGSPRHGHRVERAADRVGRRVALELGLRA